jgi:transcriptional regulator with XRE-family HTH domain
MLPGDDMTKNPDYAATIRLKMATTDNPTGAPITMREMARATGYSYEHVRKLLKGFPVGSREFNNEVCRVLGLDADEMWELAQRAKLEEKFKNLDLPVQAPDDRFAALWRRLTEEDKRMIMRMVESLATQPVGAR